MICITICVGSSCHVRGGGQVVKLYSSLLEEMALGDRIELKGSFCMERCTMGMNLKINDDFYSVETVEEAQRLFNEKILKVLEANAE